jgi:hypothetical protein
MLNLSLVSKKGNLMHGLRNRVMSLSLYGKPVKVLVAVLVVVVVVEAVVQWTVLVLPALEKE